MKTRRNAHLLGLTAVLAAAGCAYGEAPAGEPVATKQCPVTYSTGDSLNALGFLQHVLGRGLNGADLNGRLLDDSNVAFVQLSSATKGGEPMHDVSLDESKFRGRTADGKLLLNRRFKGVRFTAYTDVGAAIVLQIREARRWNRKGLRDTFLYEVEYGTEEGFRPLCGTSEDGEPTEAIAMLGRWDYREGVEGGGSKIDDPDAFTFACLGHVAAKCVEMGYKPWRKAMVCHVGEGCEKRSIGHLHQACTRMMRGDYCGDGSAHTVDGMSINAYDGYGIRVDSEDWDIEAEWTPDGAACLLRTRMDEPESLLPCAAELERPACGDPAHFVDQTSLISEVPLLD